MSDKEEQKKQEALFTEQQKAHEEKVKELLNIMSKFLQMYDLDVITTGTMRLIVSVAESLKTANAPSHVLMFCAGILEGTAQNMKELAEQRKKQEEESEKENGQHGES